jgi:hypothetical protein
LCTLNLWANETGIESELGNPTINKNKVVILIPTDRKIHTIPVYTVLDETDSMYRKVERTFSETAAGYSLKLYSFVQQHLVNQGIIENPEPAYLALTTNQGCFGLLGFYIDSGGQHIDKTKVGYIDLHRNMVNDIERLQSITQIFPHEMGHVIQMLLCGTLENENLPTSTNVHYFSITTDYRTAFSEGFAEHMENISRKLESNKNVLERIDKDAVTIEKATRKYVPSFNRDFQWPFRIAFYRSIVPFKYQQFENYKRYVWAKNNLARFRTTLLNTSHTDESILYRNTGFSFDSSTLKTIAQAESNEGVLSSFFYNLVNSEIGSIPVEHKIISSFTKKNGAEASNFRLTVLDSAYLKIFWVLHHHVKSDHYGSSLIRKFIEGYIHEFPDEERIICHVYKQSTGHEYQRAGIPELWLMSQGFSHSFWIMAHYGLKSSFYTFDLNAADECDIATLLEVSPSDAQKIIQHRDSVGFFTSLSEINNVKNVSDNVSKSIINSSISAMPDIDLPQKSFMKLLQYPLVNLARNMILWFTLFFAIFYLVYFRSNKRDVKFWKLCLTKFLGFFCLHLVALLTILLFTNPLPWFLGWLTGLSAIKYFINRNNPLRRKESVVAYTAMGLILVYSIIP